MCIRDRVNPTLVGEYFFIGVIILTCSLFIRSIGVIMALTGTNLSKKDVYKRQG